MANVISIIKDRKIGDDLLNTFLDYLSKIENTEHRSKIEEVLNWIINKYPSLETKIAWNQPMFIDHGTFIIAFSVSKNHFTVSPEKKTLDIFSEDIKRAGYDCGKMVIKVPWDDPVDYSLFEKMIDYNVADKANCETFWRKS